MPKGVPGSGVKAMPKRTLRMLLAFLCFLLVGCQVGRELPVPEVDPTEAVTAIAPTAALLAPTRPATSPLPEVSGAPAVHRIRTRVAGEAAEFYDTATGETFLLRGANYVDVREVIPGQLWEDYVFGAGTFRPDLVREAFHLLAQHGYNTVRLHFDLCARGPSCIGRPVGTGLNPQFLDQMVVVMRLAAAEGLHLILASGRVPADGLYWERFAVHHSFQEGLEELGTLEGNGYYLHPAGVAMQAQYWRDLMSDLALRRAPFEVVLGWELQSEFWLHGRQPPLSLDRGVVALPGGQRYDLANASEKRQLVADATLAWMEAVAAVIREADPDALVTVSFAPSALLPPGAPATRYADLTPLLEAAPLDFLSLNVRRGDWALASQALEASPATWQARPLILSELAVLRSQVPSLDVAALRAQEWIAESCAYGLDGWLAWEYHARHEPEGAWGLLSGEDELLRALAPANQPDPCVPTPLPVYNVALGRPATASSWGAKTPPDQAVDGSGAIWSAAAGPPQWIEIDLEEPRIVAGLRLVVAQYPPGQTHHRVWAILEDGSRTLLADLRGFTSQGQALEPVLPEPLPGVRTIRVETLESPSWVAWRELEVREAE
jgi:hypothetical protein